MRTFCYACHNMHPFLEEGTATHCTNMCSCPPCHAGLRIRKGQPQLPSSLAPGTVHVARGAQASSLQKGFDLASGLGRSMLPAVMPVIDKLAR